MNNHSVQIQNPLPNSIRSLMAHFLAPYKWYALAFVLCAMISGLYGVVNSNLLKLIIDLLEKSSNSEKMLSLILWPAIFFVINFEIHNLTWRYIAYVNYKVQPIIKNSIISESFAYVNKQSHQFFQDNLSGKISNNINVLASNLERIMHEILGHIIRGVVLLVGALASMYFVNPIFFYGFLVWTLVFCILSWIMSKNILAYADAYAESESKVMGQLVDSVANAQSVRFFARSLYENSYILKVLDLMKDRFQKKQWFLLKFHLLQGFSQTLMLGFMMYALIKLRMQELVTIGDFALILGLSVEVGFTLWWVTEQVDYLNDAIGKCNQSLRTLFTPIEIQDKPDAKVLKVNKGEIVFDQVGFHYKGVTPLFQDKSVTIAAGSKVGLVGYSGSGKSTFVNLILRVFDVTKGQLWVDGQDIRDVTQDSLRNAIGMIPQDPSLFHRSLLDNIRYGRLEATDEEVTFPRLFGHLAKIVKSIREVLYESQEINCY